MEVELRSELEVGQAEETQRQESLQMEPAELNDQLFQLRALGAFAGGRVDFDSKITSPSRN